MKARPTVEMPAESARDAAHVEQSRRLRERVAALWHAEFFSPKDFVRRATVITVLFLVVHLAGLREFTTLLNGTMGSPQLGWRMSGFLGLTYIFTYLAFVLLVPMLLLAAALLVVWKRLSRTRE
jgi:hypothetical protein